MIRGFFNFLIFLLIGWSVDSSGVLIRPFVRVCVRACVLIIFHGYLVWFSWTTAFTNDSERS